MDEIGRLLAGRLCDSYIPGRQFRRLINLATPALVPAHFAKEESA